MKILVPVKRVVDYNVKVRAKSDESGPDLSNAKMAIVTILVKYYQTLLCMYYRCCFSSN